MMTFDNLSCPLKKRNNIRKAFKKFTIHKTIYLRRMSKPAHFLT